MTTSHLDLEEELRSLELVLEGTKFRDSIRLVARHAVRPDDLVRYVRKEGPNVIHFSGHGSTGGIILRSDAGGDHAVQGPQLKRFLRGRGVEVVVLNACYSKSQADSVRPAVRAVVGTTDAVDDEAARRFTVAFYRSLGSGLSIREAFRDGTDAVALHGLPDVFHADGDLDLVLVSPDVTG
jgi:CHAT domain-containing protein